MTQSNFFTPFARNYLQYALIKLDEQFVGLIRSEQSERARFYSGLLSWTSGLVIKTYIKRDVHALKVLNNVFSLRYYSNIFTSLFNA